MVDMGISDQFIDDVKKKITPGTSALFLLTDDEVVDRIETELKDMSPELIASNLSAEQEAKLREVFAEESCHAAHSVSERMTKPVLSLGVKNVDFGGISRPSRAVRSISATLTGLINTAAEARPLSTSSSVSSSPCW